MKDLEEFESFYQSGLLPNLMGLEERRTFMKERATRVIVIAGSIVFVHWALIFIGLVHPYTLGITLLATPAAAYYYYRNYFFDAQIPHDFKDIAVARIVQYVDPSLEYDPNGFIPFQAFRDSQLFMRAPDHYSGDDFIKGEIDGLPMMMSELLVQFESTREKSDKKNDWETIFKGLFMVVELSKPVACNFFIFSDERNKSVGYVGRLIQEGNIMYGHYTHPSNPDFADNFVIYSTNPVLGERTLTDRLMDELLQLKANAGAPVHLAALDNKLYVAIEREKDFFEIDMKQSLLDMDYISSFYKDLYYVFNIINDLDVNEMLGDSGGGEED